ncbi:MAG: hypothetical protein JNN13_02575 [Planctomycetes bacterium]|nr:hypothetical protein [Planctomycetota bacterium]
MEDLMGIKDKRVWIAIGVGLLTVAQIGLAGAAFFVRRQTDEHLATEQQRIADGEARLADVAVPEPVADVEAPSSRWQLLDEPDVAGSMQVLQAVGDTTRVVFDRVKAAQSTTAGKQTFQIVGRGDAVAVCEFLAAIEQNERLIVIESGRLTPSGEDAIAFDLALATYHHGGAR